MTTPAVSVLIAAYNVTRYIPETLDSLRAQDFTNFEAILVNDGCPDTENLERVLEPYRHWIVYIQQKNGGPSAARNTALQAARAPLVALLDGDDRWMPDYLSCQLQVFERDPTVDLVYPNMRCVGEGPLNGHLLMNHTISQGEANFESLARQSCTVLNGVTMRREKAIQAGLWDTAIRHSEDFDLWLRIAYHGGRIVYHRKPLVLYRLREDSLSADPTAMYTGQLYVYEKALRTLSLTPARRQIVEQMILKTKALHALEMGRRSFQKGDYEQARQQLMEANAVLRRPKLSLLLAALRVSPAAVNAFARLRSRF
ncbi:MAG TPA: glycosyltransferase family A protein [Bryobacteraceae bacterium]|nr:glycosyltransferase family A protein [Bryobacteraceae bacterium]